MPARRSPSNSLVGRHKLWTAEQTKAAAAALELIVRNKLDQVRFSFADQHGVLRGKTLVASEAAAALAGGISMTTTLLAKDTSHKTAYPVFTPGGGFNMPEMQGGADFLMVADPTTFRVLPWAPNTGWFLCDLYFASGRPVPFSTRGILRDALARLGRAGFDFLAGLEVEFHLYRLLDAKLTPDDATWPPAPPHVGLLTQGYQLLTEARFDQIEAALDPIRRGVQALGLPLRSMEVELGPSQCEFTFRPQSGLGAADTMILFRSAVKQIARRHGYHATFMCRPALPNAFSSGWHLHQSLVDRKRGINAFAAKDASGLTAIGRHYLGGLLAHARGAAAFTTPTINGYKRYRPYSLAPDRAIWGRDNRGVMVRVLGSPGDQTTHLENRAGEPAANPYLYMAAQIHSGLDGIAQQLDPGPSADAPYETVAPLLPTSLGDALTALKNDAALREGIGAGFIDYFAHIKGAELARFKAEAIEQAEPTAWEQREYFDLF